MSNPDATGSHGPYDSARDGDLRDLPHDPGTIRPTRLEDWAESRLMRITFRPRASDQR